MTGGAFMGVMLAQQGGGAEEDYTEFVVRISTPNRSVRFSNVKGFSDGPADLRVDWGDGSSISLTSWVTVGSVFSDYVSSSSAVSPILDHVYTAPGDYTIKIHGNVTLCQPTPTTATTIGMADVVMSYKCKRINYVPTTSVLLSTVMPTMGYGALFDTVDLSECYEDPPSATARGLVYLFGTTSTTTVFTFPRRYVLNRNIGYLTTGFCQNNTGIRVVEIRDRTMAQIRAMRTGTTATSSLWDFRNFPATCEIVCTDGTIKYVNGAWTDFPNN